MLGKSKKNPVVGPLSLESTIAYAKLLRQSMFDWISSNEWDAKFLASPHGASNLEKREMQCVDVNKVIGYVQALPRAPDKDAWIGFAYLFNGAPVGIMTIKEGARDVSIGHIAASPATTDAGTALLESAVRHSERCGFLGRASLTAMTAEVSKIYARYGFRSESVRGWDIWTPGMFLDPLTSDAWDKTEQGWSLKAKIGRTYAVGGL